MDKERILNDYNKLVKKFKRGDKVIDNRNGRKYQIVNIQRLEQGDLLDVSVLFSDSRGRHCYANEYLYIFLDNFEIVLDDDKERRKGKMNEETADLVGVTKKGFCKIRKPLGMHQRIKLYGIEEE